MRYIPIFVFAFAVQHMVAQNADTAYVAKIAAHRQHYKAEFISKPRSPLTAKDTAFLDFFAPDTSWRVPAQLALTPDSQPFDMLTYSGATRRYRQYGTLQFERFGRPYTLRIYQNLTLMEKDSAYRDYLFLPFKDASNGSATYGGGRYLDFRTSDIQRNVLVLDFNKTYNPYCAYSDGYNCPIPPKENHLTIPVSAGEKMYRGEKKH